MVAMQRGCKARAAQGGFVLAATLWILAGIAIAVAMMMVWTHAQVADAQRMRLQVEDRMAIHDTRNVVLYLVSTRPQTYAGFPVDLLSEERKALRRLDDFGAFVRDPVGGEMRADGTVYRGSGETFFSIQDESGLFPLVNPDPRSLDAFLRLMGVPEEQIPRLRDTFMDYVDEDSLVRLNGAEGVEYRRAGRMPPADRRLASPVELKRIMGWDTLDPSLLERMSNLVTPYYTGAWNLNTAPRELLPLALPGCEAFCDRLVERRVQEPWRNGSQLQAAMGAELAGDAATDYRFTSDDALRLTFWGRTGSAIRVHVALENVAGQTGPWSVVAAYPVPRPDIDEPAQSTASTFLANPGAASTQRDGN